MTEENTASEHQSKLNERLKDDRKNKSLLEEVARETIQQFSFNKRFSEFLKRAFYLQENLKDGEHLAVKYIRNGIKVYGNQEDLDIIELCILDSNGKSKEPLRLDMFGVLSYTVDTFKNYK